MTEGPRDEDSSEPRLHAPDGWLNHRRWSEGAQPSEAYEYQLFSDSWFPGGNSISIEPYELFPIGPPGDGVREAVVVRATHHLEFLRRDPSAAKTDAGSFHGGDQGDEIAALLSLALGVRMASGGLVRQWFRDDPIDGRGRPAAHGKRPQLSLARHRLLPHLGRSATQRDVRDASELLKAYLHSPADKAIAIVRAARMYQQAIWVADADPNQAFIWLVSALETAAVQWRGDHVTPVEALRDTMNGVYELLSEHPELRERVAQELTNLTRATKRFIDFTMRFLPPEPERRPPEFAQTRWSKRAMKRSLGLVYGYRSGALHAGTPFPHPMCEAPRLIRRSDSDDTWAERPDANGYWAYGGEWHSGKLPVNLMTFEHITRGALQSWIMDPYQKNTPKEVS